MVFRVSETSSGMSCLRSPKHTQGKRILKEVLTEFSCNPLLKEKEEELGASLNSDLVDRFSILNQKLCVCVCVGGL